MKHGSVLRKWVMCALLSAIAVVLMFIEFPLPFLPPYLKLDFGELPALIGAFSMGPVWGVLICFIKNLINLLKTQTAGVGELANFIIGAIFVFVSGIMYKKYHSKKGVLVSMLAGTVAMCVIGFFVNYYITYPFYAAAMMPTEVIVSMYSAICPYADTLVKGLLIFNLPFTFARGVVISLITLVIYKRISGVIKGK